MVRWLVAYLTLVDPWLPDRVGAFRVFLVVLALPCCTETERDSLFFLAVMPSRGWGCGYFGLIVSSWLTLSKSALRRLWAGGGGSRGPRRPLGGSLTAERGWVWVLAYLGS